MKKMTMLLNKLYAITHLEINQDRSGIMAGIKLDGRHPVFKGHFPENPVLPGVCTVQIIKELLEESFHKSLIMTKAGNIKYLGFVNPESMPVLNFTLQLKQTPEGVLLCSATVSAQGMGVCSFKGEFSNTLHQNPLPPIHDRR
jgi:3-hydroxyacyl-[acyl-carrier-protein] dehydratase